jgi:SAM-dependent methyltransferase
MGDKKILNLGCGDDIKKDCVNIDLYNKKADMQINLDEIPYPFKSNSVDGIIALNILEHLNNPYEILLEWHRICKKGSKIKIVTPHFASGNAWGDIQHKRPFSKTAFYNQDIKSFFKVNRCHIDFMYWWQKPLEMFFNKYWGLFEYNFAGIIRTGDLNVELEAIK